MDNNNFDAIGISIIAGYWQYKKLMSLSRAIDESKNRPGLYVIGGYGPTPLPEFFLKKTNADVVVMGEGEETTRELFRAYANDESYTEVRGIAYRQEDNVTVNPGRKLMLEEDLADLSKVPQPAYEYFDISAYRMYRIPGCSKTDFIMPILSGRGCTFKCNFCYRMDTGFRPRPVDSILEEIEFLLTNYNVNYFLFSDDLLMVSKSRTVEIAEGILQHQERLGRTYKWNCNGRLNYCTPEILELMKRSGCGYINFGIEAFDNDALKKMKKGLSTDIIVKGVKQTLAAGIHPGLNMIWGNIGENADTLEKAVNFLLEYDDHSELRTIRPVTPYPGSPLYYHAIEKGYLDKSDPASDFYENKHLNSDLICCNFTDMSDDEAYAALADANKKLIAKYFENQLNSYLDQTTKLYSERNTSFRGYRQYSNASASEGGIEPITATA